MSRLAMCLPPPAHRFTAKCDERAEAILQLFWKDSKVKTLKGLEKLPQLFTAEDRAPTGGSNPTIAAPHLMCPMEVQQCTPLQAQQETQAV